MTKDLTPIRRMCEEFDVTPRTLRFYEAEGLLSPVRKGNARWYDAADRTRLDLVLRGRKYGLTIGVIRDLLDLYDPEGDNVTQLRAVRATTKRQIESLSRHQDELVAAIDDLTRELETGNRCLDRKRARSSN